MTISDLLSLTLGDASLRYALLFCVLTPLVAMGFLHRVARLEAEQAAHHDHAASCALR